MDFICVYIQCDSKLLSGFPLSVMIESDEKREARKLELFHRKHNSLCYSYIFRKQFYFVTSEFKIIGHGTPDII
jgi:hypothetical protein